jgi:glycosyltransferase involved in cell wall biosynthesis
MWHLGLTSFLHLRLRGRTDLPIVGVFTAPIYEIGQLLRLDVRMLVGEFDLTWIHLVGALVPNWLVSRPVRNSTLCKLIVPTQTTRTQLSERGIPPEQIVTIPPVIDPLWATMSADRSTLGGTRQALGFTDEDFVVAYFGAPRRLRGIDTLVRAIALARQSLPGLKLLVLARRRTGEMVADEKRVRRLVSRLDLEDRAKIVTGFLEPDEIAKAVASANLVALPFHLVPSEVPLSILEAQSVGIPVVSTRVSSIPELLGEGAGYLAAPGSVEDLAANIREAAQDYQNSSHSEPTAVRHPHGASAIADSLAHLLTTLNNG